jgi:hypothetical protein
MKIKITKLLTNQGIFDYYFTDLTPNYTVAGAAEVNTKIINIPDIIVKILTLAGNTRSQIACNIYESEWRDGFIQQLNTLSGGYV